MCNNYKINTKKIPFNPRLKKLEFRILQGTIPAEESLHLKF